MKWLLLLSLFSCAQVTSLNLKKHQFGILPTKIIWFQIAGLEEEQIAMLRFQQAGEVRTSFEQNICVGKTWNYNLYNLRNTAEASFLSQMTGKKNVKGTCEDAQLRPIWNYIYSTGYNTAVLESGASKTQSLSQFSQCGEKGSEFLSAVYFFARTEAVPNSTTFHYSEDIPLTTNQVVYDRTCGAVSCVSTTGEDVKAIYDKLKASSQKHLLIVRDFTYLKAIEKKDFKRAREILVDLEASHAEALKLTDSSDYLVLLTTGDSKFVDLPDQGKNWFDFEKEGKNVSTKRTKLTNLVLASGSRAENFCGMYDDSQVFERILSGPKQQGLELKIINPFK